jgi:hypothetical protein
MVMECMAMRIMRVRKKPFLTGLKRHLRLTLKKIAVIDNIIKLGSKAYIRFYF